MKLNNIFLGLLILIIFYALFRGCNKKMEMLDNNDNDDDDNDDDDDNSDKNNDKKNNKKIEIKMTNNQYKDFQRYLDFKNKSYEDDGGYNGSNYMSDDDNNNDDQDDDHNNKQDDEMMN